MSHKISKLIEFETQPTMFDGTKLLQEKSITERMSYDNCQTRILQLAALNIPDDPKTSDEAFREVYRNYVRKSGVDPTAHLEDGQNALAHHLQAAVISLTTGIAPPVAFPTETVYGLGADATNAASIAGIFAAKGRPSDNPLIVHVSSIDHLERCLGGSKQASAIPEVYWDLLNEFWPGPLTVLIPVPEEGKGVKFASNVHPGQNTIGFRVPNSHYARFLIAVTDRPIAAPSANSSGRPSPTMAHHVTSDLNGKINFVLDGGSCNIGVESTVVDGLHNPPLILRPGGLSKGDLKRWGQKKNNQWQYVENGWENKKGTKRKRPDIEQIDLGVRNTRSINGIIATTDVFESPAVQSPAGDGHTDDDQSDITAAPRAPGMKYKHYAPSGRMYLFEPDDATGNNDFQRVRHKIRELVDQSKASFACSTTPSTEKSPGSRQETDDMPRFAILTTTSWPVVANIADLDINTSADEGAHEGHDSPGNGNNEYVVNDRPPRDAGHDHAETSVQTEHLHHQLIHLGREPATVARNLFAALRQCDEVDCKYIFAEAPSRRRSGEASGNEHSKTDEDEFETVLERMRKASSEAVY